MITYCKNSTVPVLRLGSVQQKIPCVFETEVRKEPSKKRDCQQFQVVATGHVNPLARDANIDNALATEKVDGTCCYVTTYKDEPRLWARLDRKPTKQAERRFKKYQHSQRSCKGFTWNVEEDFRAVPDSWIPARQVRHENGHPMPYEHGHIPGWVPVDNTNKQYCWHASVVKYETGEALILRPLPGDEDLLEITSVPLSALMEKTLELIGTNVNGNPYDLGSKKNPVHVLVPHGILQIRNAPAVEYQKLHSWFQESHEGHVEGIVWHCDDGTLIKIHRHHLNLKWPDGKTFLNSRQVVINVDKTTHEPADMSNSQKNLFTAFGSLNRQHFTSLRDIQFET